MHNMDTAITTAIASTTASITSDFSTNIGSIVVIFGSLVALGLLLSLVVRLIHRKA